MRRRSSTAVLATAALVVCGAACGSPAGPGAAGDTDGTDDTVVVVPRGLAYPVDPIVGTVGIPLAPVSPSSSGGAVASYSVAPSLPAGLALDPTTGAVSGTPSAPAPSATYTVTGANAAGSAEASITVVVHAAVDAPSGLAYAENPASYTVGTAIAPNAPSTAGGPVASYEVDPALPQGLALDPSTGVISGTPAAAAAPSAYTVTARNSGGSTTATLTIGVQPALAAPASLAYAHRSTVYTVGRAIAPNAPSSTGGAVVTYAISPDLPAGLGLDPSTGVITGTPLGEAVTASYLVTATNAAGSATAELSITVGVATPAARFVSASQVVAGYRSVTIPLPPAWRPGDVLVTMLFTPTGAPTLPAGWRHAQTYNYFKVAGEGETALSVSTNRGLVAGTVAAYRGVDARAGYLPGEFASSAFPEYGGAAAAPGTYYPPDGAAPRFTPGVCGFSLGPARTEGSVAVATYQSEGSDSAPVNPHYVGAGTLAERALTHVAMVNPDTGNTDHFRLGFFDAPLGAGAGTGALYFGTTGSGGGERADSLVPYTGPVAWFTQLILSGADERGPDLTVMPPAAPVAGAVALAGSRPSGADVELACATASLSPVSYPTATTWQAEVTGLSPGSNVITAASGVERATVTVRP